MASTIYPTQVVVGSLQLLDDNLARDTLWTESRKVRRNSLFMWMDHVSDPKVINMRLCKGSREIFRISSICLTSCYLSLLATQHACAWDLISLIPNSAADSIRFSSNYSCQQQVLIIFTKPSYLHLFCRSIYFSRNERNILFIWKPRSLGTDLRDIPVQC